MSSCRVLLISILIIIAGSVMLHIVGAQPSMSWMWGVHFYAFYPGGLLWLGVLLLALACAVVLLVREPLTVWLTSVSAALSGRRLWVAVGLMWVVGTFTFWAARTTHTYLGDGNALVTSLPFGQSFHERQPLTMWLQQTIYQTIRGVFEGDGMDIEDVAQQTAAVASVLAGFLFLVVSWLLALEVSRLGRSTNDKLRTDESVTALIVWLVIVTQGYIQLFFGYVENYSFYTAGIAMFLWLALRYLRGASPLILPGVALLAGLALHLSTAVLIPAFIVLIVAGVADPRRRGKVLIDTGMTALAFVALHVMLASLSGGYSLTSALREVTGSVVSRRHEEIEGYMFSGMHYRDFLNEQLLIGPLGLWLLLPAVGTAMGGRLRRHRTAIFLTVVALTYVGASWVAGDSNLGYARNWDLLAPGALVFTIAGLGLFLMNGAPRTVWAALLCALFVSIFHTAPWIATNASAERSLARLQTLPLGYGRTEVLVSQWYRRRHNPDQQLAWLEQAIETNKYNNNAQYLLALYHFERGNHEIAATAFANAAKLRPDKVMFRQYLVQSLFELGRMAEAIEHLEFLIERDPHKANYWSLYSEALKKANRPDDARQAYERSEPIYKRLLAEDPNSPTTHLDYGWTLYNLDRYEEALTHFEASAALNPASAAAVCYIGFTLRRLGREEVAAAKFVECLTINPNHMDRADIEAWLEQIGRPLESLQ